MKLERCFPDGLNPRGRHHLVREATLGTHSPVRPDMSRPRSPHPWRRLLSRLSRVAASQLDALAFLEREHAAELAPRRILDLETLERRILLNAVPVGVIDLPTAVAAGDGPATADMAIIAAQSDAAPNAAAAAAPSDGSSRRELVVVEAGIENFEQLLTELRRAEQPGIDRELLILDADDGVSSITTELQRGPAYDAVHLLVHGSERAIRFGGEWMLFDEATSAERLVDWRTGLSAEADLLFYSCDTASTSAGRDWLASVARETGADVAASTNGTGAIASGGDWILEYQAGVIDATNLASVSGIDGWNGLLAAFTVTNTNDNGAGSFRQAILDANALAGADTITFGIGSGAQTILLSSALPTITEAVVIDATSQPGYGGTPLILLDGQNVTGDGLTLEGSGSSITGLIVSRFGGNGIVLSGTGGHTIRGNWIGLDATGQVDSGNGSDGIAILAGSDGNLIGGSSAAHRNIISGNDDDGISIRSSNNTIYGNWIGLSTAATPLGNTGDGVALEGSAGANTIGGVSAGQSNRITSNGGRGVSVASGSNAGVIVRGNDLSANGGLGIDLGANGITTNDLGDTDSGANNLLNTPVLFTATPGTSSTTIRGSFTGAASTAVTIDFYAATTPGSATSPQANTYLGSTSVTTNAYGVASFSTSVAAVVGFNQALTATATVAGSGTSELAKPVPAAPSWNTLVWIDSTNNTLERIDLDATGRQTIVTGLLTGHSAAIDPRAGFIYYVDDAPNRIRRVALDGSGGTTIYTAASGTISSLAIDSLNGHIYYTNSDNNIVGRIDLNGSNDTTIVSLTTPTALTVSEGLGAIFYSDQTTIYRRDLASGATATLASGIGQVHALIVEEAAAVLYFTDYANGSIQRVGIDGSGLTTLISGENKPAALAVDPRRNALYWAVDQNDRIRSARLDGTGAANWENGVPFADDLFFAAIAGNDSSPTTSGLSNVMVTQGAGPTSISLLSAFNDLESSAGGLRYNITGNTNGALFQNVFLDQASSTLRLTYNSGQAGTSTVTIRATDGSDQSVDTSFLVTVTPTNAAPTITTIAAQQTGPAATLGPLLFTVGDDQTAASSLVVTASSSSPSRIPNANIVLGGSGTNRTVTVTSAGNAQTGAATITLTVSDGSLTAQSQFTVTILTGTPTATADSYTMTEDGILSIPANGILTNDSDPQSNTLSAILVAAPSNAASFTLNADGSFNYTPNANFSGTDSFTYRASNGTHQSGAQTVTITINSVNDAPTISAITDQTIDEDSRTSWIPFTIQDVDSPVSNLSVSAVSSDTSIVPASGIDLAGTLANRAIRITPTANASGGPVTITLYVSDGNTTTQSTFRLTVRPVDDAPTITAPLLITTGEDVPVDLTITIRDRDTPPDQLIVSATSSNRRIVPDANLAVSGDGFTRTLTISPAENQSGGPIILTLTVTDGTSSDVRAVALFVVPINDTVQTNGFPDLIVDEDSVRPTIDLTQGFSDAETPSSALDYSVTANSNPALVSATRISSEGLLSLRLAPDAWGSATLTVRAADPQGTFTSATIRVLVNPVNDAPRLGTLSFSPDSTLTSTITGNLREQTVDVDGQPVTFRLLSRPAWGILAFDPNTGQFRYSPGTTYAATDSFTIEASDGLLATVGTVILNNPLRAVAPGMTTAVVGSIASTSGTATVGSTTNTGVSATGGSTNTTNSTAVTTTVPSTTATNTATIAPTATTGLLSPAVISTASPVGAAAATPFATTGLLPADVSRTSFGTGPGQILAGPIPTNAVMSTSGTASEGDNESVVAWLNGRHLPISDQSLQANTSRVPVSLEIRGSMLREWALTTSRFTTEYLHPEIDSLSLSYQAVQPLAQSREFHTELSKVENDLAESFKTDTLMVGSAVAVTSGLSVGYVIWLIRSGLIMTSLLAQVPAWKDIDPLTVLDSSGGQDEDGESLQSLVENDDDNDDLTLT